MPRLQLGYDLRVPPFSPLDHGAVYREMLEQCAWADRIGFDAVVLGEHHSTYDGYVPAATTASAAIAGKTSSIELRPMVIAPFHEPIHLAEELVVTDLASGGRLTPVVLGGYVRREFAMFGVDRKDRTDAMVECVETLRQAWTGEPFEFRGRMVQVTPRPFQRPRPTIVVGATSEAGARRAAHIGDEFQPARPGHWEVYVDECERIGREPGRRERGGPTFLYVTDDPERAWQDVAPYVLDMVRQRHNRDLDRPDVRGIWRTETDPSDSGAPPEVITVEDLQSNPAYQVVTPDECIALAERAAPQDALMFNPLMSGLPPELAWASLELFERAVLPKIEATRKTPPTTYV